MTSQQTTIDDRMSLFFTITQYIYYVIRDSYALLVILVYIFKVYLQVNIETTYLPLKYFITQKSKVSLIYILCALLTLGLS